MRIQLFSKDLASPRSKKFLFVGSLAFLSLAILIQFSQKNESEIPKRSSDFYVDYVGPTLPSLEFFNTGSRRENVGAMLPPQSINQGQNVGVMMPPQ